MQDVFTVALGSVLYSERFKMLCGTGLQGIYQATFLKETTCKKHIAIWLSMPSTMATL